MLRTFMCGVLCSMVCAGSAHAGDWRMFHHDMLHGGGTAETAIGAGTAGSLHQVWSFSAGSAINSSPAIAKNAATGKTVAYFGTLGGAVKAVDTATQTELWSFQTGAKVNSSPAVIDNTVYVGSADDHFYALNATTGAMICSHTVTGRIESSPVVADPGSGPTVFFGDEGATGADDGGNMWAIDATTCALRWRYHAWGAPPGSQPLVGEWSPVAYAETAAGVPLVLFGGGSPEGAVYALNANTGKRVWRFQTKQFAADQDVGAGPTIGLPGRLFPSGAVFVSGKDNMVYALNLATGHRIWRFSIRADEPDSYQTGAPRTTASLVAGRLYLGWGQGLYCLDALTGTKIWNTADTDAPSAQIISSPAISGGAGNLIVVDGDVAGTWHAWDAQTGQSLHSVTLPRRILGSAAISYGTLYVPDADGYLYAYRP